MSAEAWDTFFAMWGGALICLILVSFVARAGSKK